VTAVPGIDIDQLGSFVLQRALPAADWMNFLRLAIDPRSVS
jgi:hypothetical protein